MKAEFLEMRGSHGEIRLFAESVDDLWHLSHLVRPGDLVFATTFRSVELVQDKIRPEKPEKKPVPAGDPGRGGGLPPVREPPQDQRRHPARRGRGLPPYHQPRCRERTVGHQDLAAGRPGTDRPGRESINIGRGPYPFRRRGGGRALPHPPVRPRDRDHGCPGERQGHGHRGRAGLFEKVAALVGEITGTVVIAGPGFVKDEVAKYLKEKIPGLSDRCITVETKRSGRGAVTEALGKGVLEKITGDLQLKREAELPGYVPRADGEGRTRGLREDGG